MAIKRLVNRKNKVALHKQIVTVPLWLYIIGVGISFTLIAVGYNNACLTDTNKGSIFIDVGVGIGSSIIVSFLIDLANTIRNHQKDRFHKAELTRHYISSFLDLRDNALKLAKDNIDFDGKARTFFEWVELIWNEDSKNEGNMFDDIEFNIKKIYDSANRLYLLLMLYLENEQISKEYRYHVKRVCGITSHISSLMEKGDNKLGINSIKKSLIPTFLKYNPECERYFSEPYCVDRFSEEE